MRRFQATWGLDDRVMEYDLPAGSERLCARSDIVCPASLTLSLRAFSYPILCAQVHARTSARSSTSSNSFLGPFQRARVTAVAILLVFFRFFGRKVHKSLLRQLEWFLTGLVTPDVEFDLANRSGRLRAAGSCLETL